jgi:hypothetical protein
MVGNIVDRLQPRESLNNHCDREITFAASSFPELTEDSLILLSVTQLHEILSDPDLKVTREEEVFNYVLPRSKRFAEFCSLSARVRFQYLSPETIARLVDSKYDEITLII